jgi:hypothetical protein
VKQLTVLNAYLEGLSALALFSVPLLLAGAGNSGGRDQETGRWKVIDATGENDSVVLGESVQQYTKQGVHLAAIEITNNDGQKGQSWLAINPKGELYLNGTRFYRDSKDKVCS